VRRATGPAAFSFQSEVERSEFHRLRERFRAQLQTLRETESADENITK